ncbi:MAG TPA: hypothetical protein VER11_29430 [Polyangiaceae bacterium]|nr:hypothetical protein [Polyangiaceae bacterium]
MTSKLRPGSICDREVLSDETAHPGSAQAERGGEVVALPRKRARNAPERRAEAR